MQDHGALEGRCEWQDETDRLHRVQDMRCLPNEKRPSPIGSDPPFQAGHAWKNVSVIRRRNRPTGLFTELDMQFEIGGASLGEFSQGSIAPYADARQNGLIDLLHCSIMIADDHFCAESAHQYV